MIIRLPIDIKSLHFNIKNDNQTGHTATVATPLRQGKSVHTELAKIREIPENISARSKEGLINKILSNSRADAKITDVFVFDRVSVNNILLDCTVSFCIYIREETNPENVHFGRQKVHYPPSLKYSDEDVEIDNKTIVKAISEVLHNYAFIIEAFEYNDITKTLNFDALIVGENNIPYSKVYRNKKGVGNKFVSVFNEYADIYDTEIISLRDHLGYDNVYPENFMEIVTENKNKAISFVIQELKNKGVERIRNLSNDYPYSLYDIECYKNNRKTYVIVRFTSTKNKYFNLSSNKVSFLNEFNGDVFVALVTNINETPSLSWYSISEINSMKKAITSITFTNNRGI